MPLVPAVVDAKVISKPETFQRQRSLTLRAYLGAVSGRMLDLLRLSEDADKSFDRVDREPGHDVLEAQLYFIFTMVLEDNLMGKGRDG